MRLRATVLAIIVVLSTLALGSAGAFAADAGVDEELSDAALRPDAAENDTDGAYRGYEPTPESLDKPVDMGSAPGEFATGEFDASSAGAGASSIVMDPDDDDHPLVGTTKQYLGSDLGSYYFKPYTLLAIEDHIEVWVANDLSWPDGDPRVEPTITEAQAESMALQFEENMYGPETETFGEPLLRAGTDGLLEDLGLVPDDYYVTDDHSGNRTVLLVDNVRDDNYYDPTYPLYVAGFYSSTIQTYTDRNTIAVDAYDWNEVNETNQLTGYEGTLAHEFQHLIHADLDGDESLWLNEGMSDFAELVAGYGVSESHLSAYEEMPSNSLVNWEDQGAINVLADYGVAFAFVTYLDDQYGTDFITRLAGEPANGIESVENRLAADGAARDFYELYQDFSVTGVTDAIESPPKDEFHVDAMDYAVNASNDVGTAGVWGTNYEEIETAGKGPITDVTVTGVDFVGTEWTTATDPVTGTGDVLYSGSGNLLNRFAIAEVDLSDSASPTLTFDSFQRIEADWDYGFVQVSTDGGESWTSLENANTDDSPNPSAHPRVVENVPGFTGHTAGWESQTFDLSAYAGEEVLVAFRYVTDWAFVEDGWWVRDVAVDGEPVATDSTDSWMSLREATGDHVEYQFSFVGIKQNGNYQVKQLDMRTFEESDEQDLERFLHNGNFDRVVVASTWAAQPGEGGRVPVGVEFTYAHENGNDDGN